VKVRVETNFHEAEATKEVKISKLTAREILKKCDNLLVVVVRLFSMSCKTFLNEVKMNFALGIKKQSEPQSFHGKTEIEI
jgi:hypothetical protein